MGRFDRGGRDPSDRAPGIEFLAPRPDLFGGSSAASGQRGAAGRARRGGRVDAGGPGDRADPGDPGDPGDTAGDVAVEGSASPRRAMVAGGLATLALVAAGIALAAADHGARDAVSPSTSAAPRPPGSPPGGLPAPTGGFDPLERASDGPVPVGAPPIAPTTPGAATTPTGGEAIAAGGHLIDPVLLPGGWHAAGGLTPTAAPTGADTSAGWLELWATPGASRTTGSWFAVQTRPSDGQQLVRQDAARVALADGGTGLSSAADDGVSELVFRSGDLTVTITSAGWSSAAITEVVGSLRFDPGGRPTFADDRFRSGHRRALSRRSSGIDLASDVFRTAVVSSAHYRGVDPAGRPATVEITTRVADPEIDGTLAGFVLTDPIVLADSGTVFTPPGSDAVLSADLSFPQAYAPRGKHLLQWTVGGRTVQLTTTLAVHELNRALPLSLVRAGSVDAWARVQRGAVAPGRAEADFVELGSGRLEDGTGWTIDLQRDRGWADAMITSPDGEAHLIQLDLTLRPCGTSATLDAIVLVCVVPAGEASALRVDGADEVQVDLTPFRSDAAWLGAVLRLEGFGPLRALLVGPDGSTETAFAVGVPPA